MNQHNLIRIAALSTLGLGAFTASADQVIAELVEAFERCHQDFDAIRLRLMDRKEA